MRPIYGLCSVVVHITSAKLGCHMNFLKKFSWNFKCISDRILYLLYWHNFVSSFRKIGEAGARPIEDENIQPWKSTGKRKGKKEVISSNRYMMEEHFYLTQSNRVSMTIFYELWLATTREGLLRNSRTLLCRCRIKVVLLEGDRPSSANYQNALEFKQQRLHGERVHRSLTMLTAKR